MRKRLSRVGALTLVFILLNTLNIFNILPFGATQSRVYAESKSMQVNFPKSTSRSRSKTVTIPDLVRVTSVTVDTGTVSYSVNGNNVTINVNNGSSVSSHTSSKYISSHSYHTGSTYPPSTKSYSSGGYSGTLSRYDMENEGDYNIVQVPRTFDKSGSNTVKKFYLADGTLDRVTYSWGGKADHPQYEIDEDDYEGWIPKIDYDVTSPLTRYNNPDGSYRTEITYTAYYRGTLTKPVLEWYDDYTGYYRGNIYGSTYYYYAYNVTLNYVVNSSPFIDIISPEQYEVLGEADTSFVPTISVSDANGDTLTCSMYLDSETTPRDTKTISNTATAQTVSFDSINAAALSEGIHTMKFTVNDSEVTIESAVSFNVDKAPPVIGTVTANSTYESISISGSAADTNALHETPYRFAVDGSISQWIADTSYTFNNLIPNTQYMARFEARDTAGNIVESEQSIYTKAQVPELVISASGEDSLVLAASDSNPVSTEYCISCGSNYVGSDNTLRQQPEWITLDSKAITVNGLQPNTTYSFTAKARDAEGTETSGSAQIEGTTLALPPGIIDFTEITKDTISVSWDFVDGATGYEIEVDGNLIDNGTSTTYVHSGLQPETVHTYRVRVINTGGTGNWSSSVECATLPEHPPTPGNVTATVAKTEITVTWDAVADATGYDIEVDGIVQDNGNNTSYIHQGLEPDTTYKYRVSAKNEGGSSDWTEYISVTTLPNPPAPPSNVTSEITKYSINLVWEAVTKTDRYEIEVDGMIVDSGSLTTYLHEGLDPLTRHKYRIRGSNAGGTGEWSSYIYITTHPPEPAVPENVMASADGERISLTWYMAAYATSYEIEIDGSEVVEAAGTIFEHNGLEPASTHTYRIRSKNISGTSEWTETVTISASSGIANADLSITNLAAVVTTDIITLSWDTAGEGCEYEVEADGVLINNGFNTVFNHADLLPGTYHDYKIRVKSGDGTNDWSSVLTLSTLPYPPGAPVITDSLASSSFIQIWWEPVENAISYDVEVDGEMIEGITNVTFLHDQLLPGTAHYYRVRVRTMTDISPWSEMLEKSTSSTTYEINCTEGEEFSFSLLARNVQDFKGITFVLTYDSQQLEVVDLCESVPGSLTIAEGNIPGTNLYVRHEPGRIEYSVNGSVVPGTCWSGELTTIKFRAKSTCTAYIDFNEE